MRLSPTVERQDAAEALRLMQVRIFPSRSLEELYPLYSVHHMISTRQ